LTLLPQPLTIQQARMKNPLSLAFVGDTIWDLLTRQQLLATQLKAGALHKQAIQRVNAGAQAQCAARVEPHLTEEEMDVFRRGQNAHARHATPKNQDPYAYSRATGLEALLGYLYLTGQNERILDLFSIATHE
jgi:ribonuclease-3 family protein